MTTFSFANSVLANAAVAVAMAVLVWIAATIPFIRRRPGLRHCLWVIVLLKLVTPPLFELSILPNWVASEPMSLTHPRAIPLDELLSVSLTDTKSFAASQSLSRSGPSIDWIFILIAVAVTGTLAVVIRAMAQVWRLRRALRHGAPNDKRLDRIAAQASESMGIASPPPVCVVAANLSPLLWMRWSGPVIVVPRRLSDELSDEQVRCVVAHEIANYLRRDNWTNLLSLLVAAACWWNPVVWWARRELRIAQEACCDALVISRSIASRRKYAETLFQALEFLQAERSLLPALASGFGNKSSTERRFEMIANPLVNHRLSWWSYPVVLAALAVLPCLPSFTQAQDRKIGSVSIDYELSTDVELVPVEFGDVDGDPNSYRVIVKYRIPNVDSSFWRIALKHPGQTDRHLYKHQRSKLGIVVLAFDLESGKLAWSSEIERSADAKAVAGQRFLLHTGGGIVTIAVFGDDQSLQIQEIDAETGTVTADCRLIRLGKDRGSDDEALRTTLDFWYRATGERQLRAEEADRGGQADQASDSVLKKAREQADELVIPSGG
ncbi:MAG: M56 family metallopeptidase [Planctomycetia bacterium]|nr:M56 family metallopeptidase [Planctomycetia bacterium]